MQIGKDMFVIIEYRVHLDDGSWVRGEDGPVSLNFIVGYEQVLPALEKNLLGLSQGAKADFLIPAAEAFGERDISLVHTRTFEEFPAGSGFTEGKWVIATHEETQAQYSYYVKEKTEEAVTLDFNHPLAGRDLFYQVEVRVVRPALKEELEFLRPCEHKDDPV